MKTCLRATALYKLAQVVEVPRPVRGPFADKNVYSDKGKFFKVTAKGLPDSYGYYRKEGPGQVSNFAVTTPGRVWTKQEIEALADIYYGKNGITDSGGNTIGGVDRDQFIREVTSHNFMHYSPKFIPRAAKWLGGLLSSEKDPTAVTDMRKVNGFMSHLKDGLHSYMYNYANPSPRSWQINIPEVHPNPLLIGH